MNKKKIKSDRVTPGIGHTFFNYKLNHKIHHLTLRVNIWCYSLHYQNYILKHYIIYHKIHPQWIVTHKYHNLLYQTSFIYCYIFYHKPHLQYKFWDIPLIENNHLHLICLEEYYMLYHILHLLYNFLCIHNLHYQNYFQCYYIIHHRIHHQSIFNHKK